MQENKEHLLKRWEALHDQEKYLILELADSTTYEKRRAFKKFIRGTRKVMRSIEKELSR